MSPASPSTFYLSGTSAAELEDRQASQALARPPAALHVGSLALTIEPIAGSLERLAASMPEPTLVMLDPNCRPEAISSAADYRGRLARIVRRADVVKASTIDLDYLYPGASADDAAAALLQSGPPWCWSVTAPGRCAATAAASW